MKTKMIRSTVLTSVLAFSFALVPVAAFALESSPTGTTPIKSSDGTLYCPQSGYRKVQTIEPNGPVKIICQPKTEPTPSPETAKDSSSSNSDASNGMMKQHKLAANMLKVCSKHSEKINMIMMRVVARGTKQTELFSTIATRVEKFYADKGKMLDNYDRLVAAVNDAQTKAQNDLTSLKNMDSFKCDGSNPKGQITSFRTAMEAEIQDLKALRTSVRNLIVGVKSMNGTTNSGSSNNAGQGGSNQ